MLWQVHYFQQHIKQSTEPNNHLSDTISVPPLSAKELTPNVVRKQLLQTCSMLEMRPSSLRTLTGLRGISKWMQKENRGSIKKNSTAWEIQVCSPANQQIPFTNNQSENSFVFQLGRLVWHNMTQYSQQNTRNVKKNARKNAKKKSSLPWISPPAESRHCFPKFLTAQSYPAPRERTPA